MATPPVLLTVCPIERLLAQGHTGHWWQRPKSPSLAPAATLPSRHAALTRKGLPRQPLSGVTHALVFYTLTQFNWLSAPSPPSCPNSATRLLRKLTGGMTSQARVEFRGHCVVCLNGMLLHVWSVKTELWSCFHFICYCCFLFYFIYFLCVGGSHSVAQVGLQRST